MLKLNLGCGNKLYPKEDGWINIDVIEPTTKFKSVEIITPTSLEETNERFLFHNSLLQNLQFVDENIADEIHGYHIIEHFYKDEVEGVLKEWFRVLKPGGKIILEQPDVVKCAANFLSGLLNGNKQLEYNLGLLGFYGDGTTQKPFMGHKCGWYFHSLKEALEEVGFINSICKPAQTHMKDIRDFRIEAEKPNNEK